MNEGRIVAELPRKDASQEVIMSAILRNSGKKKTTNCRGIIKNESNR